jgi:hypothetical protein
MDSAVVGWDHVEEVWMQQWEAIEREGKATSDL